jgi:hypothetical protein
MSKSFALAIASAAFVFAASSAQAATVLTLGPSNLCSSSGCFADGNRSFTQAFSAKGGTVDVSALKLFKGIVGDMSGYAVRISFTLADGTEVGSWGSYTLAALAGDFVTIGGKAFTWNAGAGDLILKLDLIAPGKDSGLGGGFAGFGGGGGSSFLSAPTVMQGSPIINVAGPMLLPDRDGIAATIVPEPTTWALMITGFGFAGASLRRRKLA